MLSVGIVGLLSQTVNANRDTAIYCSDEDKGTPLTNCIVVQFPPYQRPPHWRQVNQPYIANRVKIDGSIVFSFGHFHRFRKNGDTELTTLGRVSFVIPPSYIFLCVYGL